MELICFRVFNIMNTNKFTYISCYLVGRIFFLTFLIIPNLAFAECDHGFHLEGVISVKDCDPAVDECINGIQAIYEYGKKLDDGGDKILTVSIMSSPWRFYGPDMRIIRPKELAENLKPALDDKVKSILVYASWTENIPHGRTTTLARELSESLDGFPVKGIDGFLWAKDNGDYYSTKQAFTVGGGFPYRHRSGDDLMIAIPYGSYIHAQDFFVKERDAKALRYAAVGWDVFILCPDIALQTFEAAAALSDSISAYNAAVIRLERGQKGDFDAASKLLNQASDLGDDKAKALLLEITSKK